MNNKPDNENKLPENILFSVLIANYNNGRYIVEAIESIYKQTYNNWEIIIVDDASTDNSIEILQPFLLDERIKLFINDENRGCGFTKKRCVEEAIGELCGYLDPDDALTDDALEEMVNRFRQFPHSGLINSKNYYCDENLQPQSINPYSKEVVNNGPYIFDSDGSITHFAVFRKDYYLTTERLSPQFTKAVDQDLYLLMDQTGPIHFVDKVLYFYRIHKGGISTFDNVIPATYQHFEILRMASLRRLKLAHNQGDIQKLQKVYHRTNFHLAMLERKRIKSVFLLARYALNGGMDEIKSMFGRLILNPRRMINSIFKVYTIKS